MRRVFLVLAILICTTLPAEIVRRAVFEIGSNKTKLEVSDVDIEKGEIVCVILRDFRPIPFQWNLSQSSSNSFSPRMLRKAERKIRDLYDTALELGATEMQGVATAAMRVSNNGAPFLANLSEELGFPIQIISQEMEGISGLYTAASLRHQPVEELIAWDCGGGSFQLTALIDGQPRVWMGEVGTASFTALAIEHLYGVSTQERTSPNPVSQAQIEALLLHLLTLTREPPTWLLEALKTKQVIGLGGPSSIFGLVHHISGDPVIPIQRAYASLWAHVGLCDEEITWHFPPAYAVPRLVLLCSTMTQTGMKQVEHIEFSGNTPGLIVMEQIWRGT